MFGGYSIFAVGPIWLDHEGSLRRMVSSEYQVRMRGPRKGHLEVASLGRGRDVDGIVKECCITCPVYL